MDAPEEGGQRSPTRSQSPEKVHRRSRSRSRSPARSPARSRSRSPQRQRSASPQRRRSPSRDRHRRRSPSHDRHRRRSPSRDRYRRRSPSRDRYRRHSPPRGRGYNQGRSPSPQRRRSPPRAGTQLFVAGIPFVMNERDMMEKFGRYGRVREARVVRNMANNMESKGFGFVIMEDEDGAQRCVRNLNQSDWNGRRLLVEVARHPR